MLDTGTGPIAFVVVYAIWGLKTAAIVAIALGVVMAVERVARKKTVVNVLGGLFVTAVLAAHRVAHRQGRDLLRPAGADPGRLRDRVRGLGGDPPTDHRLPRGRALPGRARVGELPSVRRAMIELTLAWAALFGSAPPSTAC